MSTVPVEGVVSGGVALLTASDISLSYDGDRYLFRDISFTIARGAKLALVGENGAGKSSLLKVLRGSEASETGSVDTARGTRITYVEQEPQLPAGSKAEAFIFRTEAPPAVAALAEYRAAVEAADACDADADAAGAAAASARLGVAAARMDDADAWGLEDEILRLCSTLEVDHLLQREAATLSGGERKRVALAAALLSRPDLLLLDEPTNHLDIGAIRFLEEELAASERAALVVTHDRSFLSAACDEVIELCRSQIYRHRGTDSSLYEDFLEAKQARLEAEGVAMQAARNKMRKELAWVRKQPKARESKSKSRLDAFQTLSDRVAKGTQAINERGSVSIDAGMQRLGSKLLTCADVRIDAPSDGSGPPRAVVDGFNYEFLRKDRVGIVGPNGAGKTTLLRALQGQLPLAGGVIEAGDTLVWGHYEQQGLQDLPGDYRVLTLVKEAVAKSPGGGQSADADEKSAASLLSKFLFPPRRWNELVSQLSGGERRRLQMLQVLARAPNFLLLDEPTNDLDLDTIQVLEDFLVEEYAGVLLVVSHDRYFLDRAVDHLFVLPGDGKGEVLDWQASFSDYLAYRDADEREQRAQQQRLQQEQRAQAASTASPAATAAKRGGGGSGGGAAAVAKPLSSFELKQYERLEAEMEAIGEEQDELQRRINGFDDKRNGYSELTEWTEQASALAEKLEVTEEKWLVLAERVDL